MSLQKLVDLDRLSRFKAGLVSMIDSKDADIKAVADYVKLYAETLNSGADIPLNAVWVEKGLANGGGTDNRAYRVHTANKLIFEANTVIQAAEGYRFYLQLYNADGTVRSNTEWYGPGYASRKTYAVPAGTILKIIAGAYPEDTSVTADPAIIGPQITIVNNLANGGGSGGTDDYTQLTNKPSINGVELSGNKTLSQLGVEPESMLVTITYPVDAYVMDKSYAEIKSAMTAGKSVTLVYNEEYYRLATWWIDDSPYEFMVFSRCVSDETDIIMIDNEGTVSRSSTSMYIKPSGGIPKSDLSSDVQASLGKADTALQEHQSLADYRKAAAQDVIDQQLANAIPTKTSDLTNDSGFLTQHQDLTGYATETWVQQQGYLTQHQDISGKADKVTEVTISTAGDVTAALDAGKICHFTGAISSLTLTLNAAPSGTLAQYHFDFDSGSTAPTVTIPSTVTMPDGFAVEASKHYEVDILNGYGAVCAW